MNKRFTIHDLAGRANVSIATISRTINPETRNKVAPETLEKIDRLVWDCGYAPSAGAKQIRKTNHQTLGVLFPHHEKLLTSDYYMQILAGVADSLLHSDYIMKLIMVKPNQRRWDRYDFKNAESVDGLILAYWRTFFSNKKIFKQLGVPCVVINNVEKDVLAHFSAGDHYEGGRIAALCLTERGHRHIGVFGGIHGAPDARVRLQGFRKGLEEQGLKWDPAKFVDVSFEENRAYAATEPFLSANPKVTALFCMNDVQAYGVLRRLHELKISCPNEISVMGYDDELHAQLTNPPLTTIRVPVYEIAKRGTERLLSFLTNKGKKTFYQPEYLSVQLVERKSVRIL